MKKTSILNSNKNPFQKQMKKLLVLAIALFIPLSSAMAYSDVTASNPAYDAINYLTENKIVSGYEDGTFQPSDHIDRAEFLKIMIESKYSADDFNSYSTANCFSDVPANEWYTKYVCFAKSNNIIAGYDDGTFQPETYINFAESSKIVANTYKIPVLTTSPWYKAYVQALESRHATPTDLSTFDQLMTRGQMAEIAYRLNSSNTSKPSTTFFCTGEGIGLGALIPSNNNYCCTGLIPKQNYNNNLPVLGVRGTCVKPGTQIIID